MAATTSSRLQQRPAVDEELLALAPSGILRDLAQQNVPFEDLKSLVEQFGGTRIWVPLGQGGGGPLYRAVGKKLFLALWTLRRSERVHIPLARGWQRLVRHREILAMFEAGATTRQIARRFQMSQRGVFLIVRKKQRDARNLKPT